jgi:hypothetical protein
MEVSGQLHVPAVYPRGKSPKYPLYRSLGGPQSRSGRGGRRRNSRHCPCRELNHSRPIRSLVSTLTELTRLSIKINSTELNDRGSRIQLPVRAGNFSLHHRVQNGSVTTQPPIQWVQGALSRERGGKEADV